MNPPPAPAPLPIVLVEGSAARFERAVSELRTAGWRLSPGFDGPTPGVARDARHARFGPVATADDAAGALLAVLAGVGVIMHGVADRDVLDRLLGDLRHVGPVDHRPAATEPEPTIDDEARAILRHLAEGQTLGEAADALGLSRRTADRRLADARLALGVHHTIEAVSRARRLGWLG